MLGDPASPRPHTHTHKLCLSLLSRRLSSNAVGPLLPWLLDLLISSLRWAHAVRPLVLTRVLPHTPEIVIATTAACPSATSSAWDRRDSGAAIPHRLAAKLEYFGAAAECTKASKLRNYACGRPCCSGRCDSGRVPFENPTSVNSSLLGRSSLAEQFQAAGTVYSH